MKSRSFTKLHSWLKVTLSSKQPIKNWYKSRRWKHWALKGIMLVFHSYEKVFCLKFYRIHMPLQLVWVGHSMPQCNSISGHRCLGWRYGAQTNADLCFFFYFSSYFFPPLFSVSDVSVWPGLKRYWRVCVDCRQTERLRWTLCADMTVLSILVFLKKWNGQHFFFNCPSHRTEQDSKSECKECPILSEVICCVMEKSPQCRNHAFLNKPSAWKACKLFLLRCFTLDVLTLFIRMLWLTFLDLSVLQRARERTIDELLFLSTG